MTMRLGVKLPHTGSIDPASIADRAVELEQAGFDSLWVSDHVVLPEQITSYYPFAADGVATWASDQPWVETVVVLATAAAVTHRIRIGTAVLIAPQRNPVLLAKQIGCLSAVSSGRIDLGVGAGWLREEFEALDSDFDSRGPRLEEWIELLRSCWTGRPDSHNGPNYRLAAGTLMLPAPAQRIPVLVGGHSRAALRRAGQLGDGWLAQQSVPDLSLSDLSRGIGVIQEHAARVGREAAEVQIVLRLVESRDRHDEIAAAIPGLGAVGVDEIIVDVDPEAGDPAVVHDVLRAAVDHVAAAG